MMRRIVLLWSLLLLPAVLVFAQQKRIEIPWNQGQATDNKQLGTKSTASSFQKSSLAGALDITENILSFHQSWTDSQFVNENTVRLENVQYAPLTAAERARINTDLVPDRLTYSLQSGRARNEIISGFQMSPVVRQNGAYQKVVSFDLAYTYKSESRSPRMPITNSVLASGDWFKFKVEQTGIHRITLGFLRDLGMNTNGINPNNIKIYGNGGQTLPLLNSANTEFDLFENAIQVLGAEDGVFDDDDEILFYATSTRGYVEENDSNLNPYSDDSFYYITADGGPGKRVTLMVEPSGTATTVINSFDDYQFHEVDEFSPAKVGRRWYGNRFDIESEQQYEFTFPNIVPGEDMGIRIKAAAASESITSMALTINGASVDPLNFARIDDPKLLDSAEFNTFTTGTPQIQASGETVTIGLVYNNAGNPSSIAYLDYISVEAKRRLSGTDGQLAFRYNDAATLTGIGEFQIDNANQFSQVWDVTNPGAISTITNNSGASFSFKANLGEVREYVAVNPSNYFTPVRIGQSRVPNQNLKGTIFNTQGGSFQDIDMLIVTAPFLIQPALRLAQHRAATDGLVVKVVTTDKIYEEFSSGKKDITAIRNFVRYIYENGSTPSERLKYLCLFGDASVDYKNRLSNNNDIVPTFHTVFSEDTFRSYMTDDFYGSMDADEGLFLFNQSPEKLDIAVGRILADEVGLANAMVDKIVAYADQASYGNWRTNFVLVSDDVDEHFEYAALQRNLDRLGDQISDEKPFINVKKIHSDAFQQETSAGGNRYPKVNEAIINSIEVGTLVMNYFGHGGEDGLAKEFMFIKEEAQNLSNRNRYPCIITVTCEFTKFDNPLRITAGELTFWNREGGAISMVTTTRSIGVSLGVRFNQDLAAELFGFGVNVPNTPAEALRIAKVAENSPNRRVIYYLGDPSMRLAFPKPSVRLTTINGVPIEQSNVVLQALSRVRLGGEVTDANGNVLTDYSGVLEAKVFDKNVQRETLANDGVRDNSSDVDGDGDPNNILKLQYIALGEGLFNGQATVNNGRFEFEFVVPRDIQIPVGNGRVSLYTQRNNALDDQSGANLDIQVGGLDENAPEDNVGPQIRLFMNDESFVSGGVTNDSPILLALLEDENGINTASGIGHDLIAILDGDEANPFVLNEYYQAEVDDFTRGRASYSLRDLEEGLHTLTIRAWDVYNNSSTAEIQFVVAGDDKLEITRVLNYPNPFVNYTEFWFNHNRPFEPLEVQVQVFTVTGKVVWTRNQIVSTDGFLSREITWDGRDDFGDRIGKGVYVYKITVKSTLTNQRVEKFEKLVIL